MQHLSSMHIQTDTYTYTTESDKTKGVWFMHVTWTHIHSQSITKAYTHARCTHLGLHHHVFEVVEGHVLQWYLCFQLRIMCSA